jgi:L-threonylcarbamoyladenylate synthase
MRAMSPENIKPDGETAGGMVPADEAAIARAAEILRAGGLVAFPTETVYGLGADATNDRAVAAIFAAKGRPRFNPLIVHLPDFEQTADCVLINRLARAAAERFWPGPLTLVLPRRKETKVSYLCSAGLDSLAVRVPAHPVAQALLAAIGRPLAAPSANVSGGVSPTAAAHVAGGLDGRIDLILDGGPCAVGLESSVLDLTGERPVLLRPGGIAKEDLEATLGPIAEECNTDQAPRSPGRLASHYAPGRPLRLDAREVGADEALLAFGPSPPAGARTVRNLSERGDLVEAAANLFAMLHALDDPRHAAIAVMPVPDHGLGAAINDRLRRAAAPRD